MPIKPIPKTIPQVDDEGQTNERWLGYYLSIEGTVNTEVAPNNASYITRTSNSTLSNEQALSSLSTGFVQVTTGTGVLSSTGSTTIGTTNLANDAVTYAKIQNVSATDKVLGRSSSGSGDVEEISCTSVGRGILANSVDSTSYTPTVTLVGGAGNTTPVYSTNIGYYLRIGSQVFVDVYLTGDGGDEGAGSGVINIALPLTANANHPTNKFPCGFGNNSTTDMLLFGTIAGSATTIALSYLNTISASADFTGVNQNNMTRTIRLKFSYFV